MPVADLSVAPENESLLREALGRALEFGKGVVHVLFPLERLEQARAAAGPDASRIEGILGQTVFSTRRACPSCSRSFPELDPRLFSYNSKHGWCPECYGTGLAISGFDEEQSGEGIW